jgi:hypothetical protein
MPEFVLDLGSVEAAKRYNALSYFCRGYIEAMFFTSESDEEMSDISFDMLAPSALAQIVHECRAFERNNEKYLDIAYELDSSDTIQRVRGGYDSECAGRDLWYTRNGHGVGYRDRELGAVVDHLTERARTMGESDLYRGDDGLLYVSPVLDLVSTGVS